MKISLVFGFTTALICIADVASAKTPDEIKGIAKAVTVEIKLTEAKTLGSGIIINRQGNLYTIVTNRHVVCGKKSCSTLPSKETYTLGFSRGERLRVPVQAVKLVGQDLDLAIVQFRSSRPLAVAQVALPGSLRVDDKVFTSGYPLQEPGFSFNSGQVIAVVNKRLKGDNGGYTIIYDAETQPGMSGGGVFNENGLLVAIHGRGDRYQNDTEDIENRFTGQSEVGSKIGYNRGISVRWLQGIAPQTGKPRPIGSQQVVYSKADEHFIAGFNKWIEPGQDKRAGRQEALREFSQAIQLNPRYKIAYIMRAVVYEQLEQYKQALDDFNTVILLDPQNAHIYHIRGRLKHLRLDDHQGALVDFKKAVAIEPGYAHGWYSRGFRHLYLAQDPFHEENRTYYSLEECNRAIASNPQDFKAYLDRGILVYTELKDRSRAIVDIRLAVKIAKAQDDSRVLEMALKALRLMGVNE